MQDVEKKMETKFGSIMESCYSKSGKNPDKFANCVYDQSTVIQKEQTLFSNKLAYLGRNFADCMTSKSADMCKKETVELENKIADSFISVLDRI